MSTPAHSNYPSYLSQKQLLAVPTKHDENMLIKIKQVLYVKAEGNYVWLHYKKNKKMADKILLCKQLGEIQQQLEPFGIVRIHRSFLINYKRVSKINFVSKYLQVELTDGYLHYADSYEELIKKLFTPLHMLTCSHTVAEHKQSETQVA